MLGLANFFLNPKVFIPLAVAIVSIGIGFKIYSNGVNAERIKWQQAEIEATNQTLERIRNARPIDDNANNASERLRRRLQGF
jgi:hypothetical protein